MPLSLIIPIFFSTFVEHVVKMVQARTMGQVHNQGQPLHAHRIICRAHARARINIEIPRIICRGHARARINTEIPTLIRECMRSSSFDEEMSNLNACLMTTNERNMHSFDLNERPSIDLQEFECMFEGESSEREIYSNHLVVSLII